MKSRLNIAKHIYFIITVIYNYVTIIIGYYIFTKVLFSLIILRYSALFCAIIYLLHISQFLF